MDTQLLLEDALTPTQLLMFYSILPELAMRNKPDLYSSINL